MCLMLYLATDPTLAEQTLPEQTVGELSLEAVAPEIEAGLDHAFSRPCRRFVSVDGGCSCAFPHLMSESPPDCFPMLLGSDADPERQQQKRLVAALRDLVADVLRTHAEVELYASWVGHEAAPPARRVELRPSDLAPESFCFIEQWLYVVHR